MARRTREELIEEIKNHLSRKPLSINELADEKLKSNWSTIRDIIQFMEKLDIVEAVNPSDKIKEYRLIKLIIKKRNDTWFGLPLTEEEEKTIKHLFSRIKSLFLEKLHRSPKDTEVQKTAIEVAKACNLNIPRGWYLFGLITVMKYDDRINYQTSSVACPEEKVDREILISIESCKQIKYVRDLSKRQYEKYDNKLYKIKEELKKVNNQRLDLNNTNSRKTLQKLLSALLFYLPTDENAQEVIGVTSDYVNTMNRLLVSKIDLNDLKSDLSDAFDAIWKYLATYYFFDTVTDTGNYDRKTIYEGYFKSSLEDRKEIAYEHINYLKEQIQKEDEIPILKLENPETDIIRKTYEDMAREIK